MKYTNLPNTDIEVSKICLGTMTYGEQNFESEAHAQMSYAFERGVNFFDTAEMYPVPSNERTRYETERMIGTWFRNTGLREKIVLGTKIVGKSPSFSYIRDTGFSKGAIIEAVEGSLKRLRTDYIDLYQLHWPTRSTNVFGTRNYTVNHDDLWVDDFQSVLETLGALIKEGKIRQIGISNETPWGTMKYLEAHKNFNLPKTITIQNAYNLINRGFEDGLAEITHRENIGLLAYSPLAFGMLTGKYMKGRRPSGSRLVLYPQLDRYYSKISMIAIEKYFKISVKYRVPLAKMAIRFVTSRPFVTAAIIGATGMKQLKEDIDSIDTYLNDDLLEEISKVYKTHPNPTS